MWFYQPVPAAAVSATVHTAAATLSAAGSMVVVANAGPPTATWNTSGSNYSLDATLLIATWSSFSGTTVRTNFGSVTGDLRYVEVDWGTGSFQRFGLCTAAHSIANYPGGSADSIAIRESGLVEQNSATVATLSAFNDGYNGELAWSDTNVWFRFSGGFWNDSPSANPATNTGGIPHNLTGIIYACGSAIGSGVTLTLKPSVATWSSAPPSGFSALAPTSSITHNAAAALSATGNLTASVGATNAVASTQASVSTLTAAAQAVRGAASTQASVSTLTAAAGRTVPGATTQASVSTLTAAVTGQFVAATTQNAISGMTATAGSLNASTTQASTSTLTATVRAVYGAATTQASLSGQTGTATAIRAAATTQASVSGQTAAVIRTLGVATTQASVSGLTAAAVVRSPVQASATMAAISGQTAAITIKAAAAIRMDALSAFAADAVLRPAIQISATLDATSSLTAAAAFGPRAISTTLSASSAMTATALLLWEPTPPPGGGWDTVPGSGEIWTPASTSSGAWA
jgi:hypothetical protein